ncbi:MAG: AAA domain-containing protein [Bacteroidota bacterium]
MQSKQLKELEHLRKLVELERQEERKLFLEVIQKLPLRKRVQKGWSWYPLQMVKKGYTIGERPFVILERSGEEEHRFRAGMSVDLFTEQAHVSRSRKSGVIKYVKSSRIKVILGGSDHPNWLNGGQLGIDLMFDERTYREMDRALEKVMKADDNRLAELRDILMGGRKAQFTSAVKPQTAPEMTRLNEVQGQALSNILAAKDLAIVHGPPGTGKTTTLVAAIQELILREDQLLVATPSNAAADLICIRLAEKNIPLVRVGNLSRVDDEVMRHTLEAQLAAQPDNKQIKKLRREAADLRRKAQKQRGREKGLLYRDAGQLSNWANQLEDRLLDYVIASARVVVTTLVGAAANVLEGYQFSTCLIDEAAQALEPACWIPISKSERVILAGDPFQLPPTVKSRKAEQGGLATTLLEKCIERHPAATCMLEVQYRMNEKIMGFSNQHFYEGKLKADVSVARQTLPNYELSESITYIDTAGTGFEEKINNRFQSRYNENELQLVIEHLIELIGSTPPEFSLPSIALISPYREQVVRARELFDSEERFKDIDLTIDTIDGFQGQERDLVYLSLVRSNDKGEIGFLKDYRRINVAMTRARKQLVIIGDSATIGADPFYTKMLKYIEDEGSYVSGFVYIRVV